MNQIKVIIINDIDGHTDVLRWSVDNLRKTVEALLEAFPDEFTGDPEAFLSTEPDAPSLEYFLLHNCSIVNSRGGPCHILEAKDWDYNNNPFA